MSDQTDVSMHIYCENCGYNCEISYEKETEEQEAVFCPFCGEESLFEELIDPSEDDDFEDDGEEDDDDDDD